MLCVLRHAPGDHCFFAVRTSSLHILVKIFIGNCHQVNREIRISHSGKSDVYVTGYTTHHFLTYGSSEEELDSGEELSSDEEEVPTAIPLANGAPGGQVTDSCAPLWVSLSLSCCLLGLAVQVLPGLKAPRGPGRHLPNVRACTGR